MASLVRESGRVSLSKYVKIKSVGWRYCQWKRFASDHFGVANTSSNLPELIAQVNATLDDFDPSVQRKLLLLLLGVLECPPPQGKHAIALFNAGLMPRIKDLAPYAASVMRLYLTFMIGLSRGFIGLRTSRSVSWCPCPITAVLKPSRGILGGDSCHGGCDGEVEGVEYSSFACS